MLYSNFPCLLHLLATYNIRLLLSDQIIKNPVYTKLLEIYTQSATHCKLFEALAFGTSVDNFAIEINLCEQTCGNGAEVP